MLLNITFVVGAILIAYRLSMLYIEKIRHKNIMRSVDAALLEGAQTLEKERNKN